MEDGCGVVGKYHCFNFKQLFLFSMFFLFLGKILGNCNRVSCKIYSRQRKKSLLSS